MSRIPAISLCSENHVLMHKRALFINCYITSLMAQYIQQNSNNPDFDSPEDVIEAFGAIANRESSGLSDEEISDITRRTVNQMNHPRANSVIRVDFDS